MDRGNAAFRSMTLATIARHPLSWFEMIFEGASKTPSKGV